MLAGIALRQAWSLRQCWYGHEQFLAIGFIFILLYANFPHAWLTFTQAGVSICYR